MNIIEFIQYKDPNHPEFNPIPSKKLIPEWYKKINRYIGNKEETCTASFLSQKNILPMTVKSCIPVQDYICNGYIIRAGADLLFTQQNLDNGEIGWTWYSRNKNFIFCGSHDFSQLPIEIDGKKNTYIKIEHNIGIKTPKGYSCFCYQPEFFFETRFKLFPGIVDTDTYHHPINFSGFITTKEKNIMINAGTPLMVVMPFKRNSWVQKTTFSEKNSINVTTVENWYKKFFHSEKSYD